MEEPFKSYFWKRFWFLLIPIYIVAVINEPFITNNDFSEWEDYLAFFFFLLFYFIGYAFISALIIHMLWRFRTGRNKR
ncbi:hypothetical protein [Halobacillus litoralis]|uniref:hypothetical protein n=1 Tax=Halobacillus litoralis TaxID=45668 RepID=UPI001CFF36D9|nr:hypothetical protein [Halobacillus litoralis]